MKNTIAFLAFLAFFGIAVASAALPDSSALARFRADTTLAGQIWRTAAHADSTAYQGRIQAQVIFQLAAQHLAQDTARK